MKSKMKSMTFEQAVKLTPDLTNCYKPGLTALGNHSTKVSVGNTQRLNGSVDIDSCTTAKYPQDSRWDYVFSYKGEAFFVEVHSASMGEVKSVLKKFEWLKNWLRNHAPEIDKIKSKDLPSFYWIQSKGFDIPKTSPQYRAAKKVGLIPISVLNLSQ